MSKSLAKKLYLKQKLYSFRITESKARVEQMTDFSKIVDDLENTEVKLEDEDNNLILLSALPKMYEHFKDIF